VKNDVFSYGIETRVLILDDKLDFGFRKLN